MTSQRAHSQPTSFLDGRAGPHAARARRVAAGAAGALALAALVTLAGCRSSTPPAPPPPKVTVTTPTQQPVTNYVEFTGNTAATDSVTLVARVEGYLEKIHFTDGAEVKKGDVLFTIQQSQYRAQLQQAEAQLAAQQAALVHAKTELTRYTELVKEESAPQTEVDRWAYERDSAEAGIQGAQAQIELAKLNLGYTTITAPFDGRMGRHLVDPGNVVGGAAQPTSLATIDRIDPLYVYFTIAERDLLRIRADYKGAARSEVTEQTIPAEFGLLDQSGYPFDGHLDFAALAVAPTTGTLQARALFANPLGVLPGLFVRVRIPVSAESKALVIPGEAIAFDQQGEYVLVVNGEGVVARQAITTGAQVGDEIVVTDGLAPTDRVIVAGLARAIPGRKVTAEEAPPSPTPSPGTAGAAASPTGGKP